MAITPYDVTRPDGAFAVSVHSPIQKFFRIERFEILPLLQLPEESYSKIGYCHISNNYITLSFRPFRGDSTRNEVDIAEKGLIHALLSTYFSNC
jgi:hypothetical protein